MRRLSAFALTATLTAVAATPALAQSPPDPAARIAKQQAAMKALSWMDGVWRGPAVTTRPGGQKITVTQTERSGPLLDGSVHVVEGRGYNADGTTGFNALGIISYDPDTNAYSMRSYAMGRAGDFPLTLIPNGAVWTIPAGPATLRYTITAKDGVWHEVGERVVEGQPPVQFFEMTLKRIGDSSWPTAGAIPPN
jgi:hypothetical protein